MQHLIDKIVESSLSFEEKTNKLKEIFIKNNINYFSDFDDTLSDNSCVFYTKVKLLKKFKFFNKNHLNKLLISFKINKNFPIRENQKIVIISRNKHDFLQKFLKKYYKTLKKENINVVGVIGNSKEFSFSSLDKLKIISDNSFFIGDSFENEKLQNYGNFINVSKFSKTKIQLVKAKKIFILVKFILKGF